MGFVLTKKLQWSCPLLGCTESVVFPNGYDIDDLIQPVWHFHEIIVLEVKVTTLGQLCHALSNLNITQKP